MLFISVDSNVCSHSISEQTKHVTNTKKITIPKSIDLKKGHLL